MKTLKVGTIVECKCPAGFSRVNYKDRCEVESVGKFYTKLRTLDSNIVFYIVNSMGVFYFREVKER
jgi:hypothetical protein